MTDPDAGDSSTINIIVLVDGGLSRRAFVDSIRTATEAKASALKALDLRDRDGSRSATGTPTDGVVIASTSDEGAEYAGPVSGSGNLIAKSVRKASMEALENCG
ncbi:MAG: adenosylcobinamide amidohydrolase, partial [Candidatus Aenigmatarchaeota archaeon]